MSELRDMKFGVCETCLKFPCQCCKTPPTPTALTREQVEYWRDCPSCRTLRATIEHLKATLAKREEELEAYVWTISPAMAQAKIDGQNQHIQELQATLAARDVVIGRLKNDCIELANWHADAVQRAEQAEARWHEAALADADLDYVDEARRLRARIEELEGELHTAKTQCGENAISHMIADQEARRLREALVKIAKPALGGKQQQWIAQEALKGEA